MAIGNDERMASVNPETQNDMRMDYDDISEQNAFADGGAVADEPEQMSEEDK